MRGTTFKTRVKDNGSYKAGDEEFKLDPVVKEAWLLALRSRTYTQCQGSLSEEDTFVEGEFSNCCLGVLANSCFNVEQDLMTCDGMLSRNLFPKLTPAQEFGMYAILPGSIQDVLAGYNDADDLPFYKIARIIERNL